jgi:hypothetical protein
MAGRVSREVAVPGATNRLASGLRDDGGVAGPPPAGEVARQAIVSSADSGEGGASQAGRREEEHLGEERLVRMGCETDRVRRLRRCRVTNAG